jgi:hypothetical protein
MDINQPFEQGQSVTPDEALEVSEFVLQGVTNAYRDLTHAQTVADPDDHAAINLVLVMHETIANGIDLSKEWRDLAEAKRQAEAFAQAQAEFEAASAEVHAQGPGWNGR